MALDGPRLANGMANKDASEGGTPAAVKLPGVTGGSGSVDKEEVGTPIPYGVPIVQKLNHACDLFFGQKYMGVSWACASMTHIVSNG